MIYQTFSAVSPQEAVSIAVNNILATGVAFIPRLLAAIVMFLFGLLLAGWVKTIVKKVLQLVNISQFTKNSAIDTFLKEAQVKVKIEELLGEVARWLIVILFFITAVNILGLTTVSAFLTGVLSYLPKVFSAALIFVAGLVVAGFVEGVVKGAVGSINPATGRLVGKMSSYTVMIFTSLAAISELGIAAQFINSLFIGFVAMLALAFGLAFGLGAKDIVASLLGDWYKTFKKDQKRK